MTETAHLENSRNAPTSSDIGHEGSQRVVRRSLRWFWAYVAFTAALCLLGGIRLWWSWPDAPYQSNFWFLSDLQKLLDGNGASATWFSFGNSFALNGYRWFEYINALLFGFDSRLENICYYLIIFIIATAIGVRALGRLPQHGRVSAKVAVFLIPIVLASMAGSGSRGMELGTFTGAMVVVFLFLLIDSRLPNRIFTVVAWVAVPLDIFIWLGGYAAGPTLALVAVWLLQFWRPTLPSGFRRRLTLLTGNFVAWTIIFFALIPLLKISKPLLNQPGGGLGALEKNPLFPFEFLFWGPAASLISSETVQGIGSSGLVIAAVVSIGIVAFTCLIVIAAYKRAWSQTTIPLLLILYPWGIAIGLIFTRNSGVENLLDTWYSLHFKVSLVGLIWLSILAVGNSTEKWRRHAIPVATFLVCMAITVAFANVQKYERQPFERVYFLSIAEQELYPSQLVKNVPKNGVTSMQLSPAISLRAVEFLKKYHLSIYREPLQTLVKIFGAAPDYVTFGQLYGDGWAGRNFTVDVFPTECDTLSIKLTDPIPQHPNVPFTVDTNFGTKASGTVDETGKTLVFRPTGSAPTLTFKFGSTFEPSKLGIGQDTRSLSAVAALSCK